MSGSVDGKAGKSENGKVGLEISGALTMGKKRRQDAGATIAIGGWAMFNLLVSGHAWIDFG